MKNKLIPTIVTLKAFGDFVIACNVVKNLNAYNCHTKIQIIAYEHVRELAVSMKAESFIKFIGKQDLFDVPSIFNIKKAGILPAVVSLFELRRTFNATQDDASFLFDNLGWREKIIGCNHTIHGLSKVKGNVYLDYFDFYSRIGLSVSDEIAKPMKKIETATIIPGARMQHRVIPVNIIQAVATELKNRGVSVTVVLLEGESIEIPTGINIRRIPRRFDALTAELTNSDLVVSADSLPAHLSEYFNIPIFVFTPTPDWSIYWLPKSSFLISAMSSFKQPSSFKNWLDINFHFDV